LIKNLIIVVLASLLVFTIGFFLEITEGTLSGLLLYAVHKSSLIGGLYFDPRLPIEFGITSLVIFSIGIAIGRNQRG
jgi:hypothetical protein